MNEVSGIGYPCIDFFYFLRHGLAFVGSRPIFIFQYIRMGPVHHYNTASDRFGVGGLS